MHSLKSNAKLAVICKVKRVSFHLAEVINRRKKCLVMKIFAFTVAETNEKNKHFSYIFLRLWCLAHRLFCFVLVCNYD